MTVVQLTLRRDKHHTLGSHIVCHERISVLLAVLRQHGSPVVRDAIVDTGSPLTVFPQKVWQQFSKDIVWLTRLDDPTVPKWLSGFAGATGGQCLARVGLVSVEFFDLQRNRIGPVEIVAWFAQDRGTIKDVLLGLGGDTLRKRRIEILYDAAEVLLSET